METIKLLEKGPKFVLNSRTSSIHDKVELENLCKNLENINIFDKQNKKFTEKLHQFYLKYEKNSSKNNILDQSYKNEIKSLTDEENLVITKTDKGNSIVILDKPKYKIDGGIFLNSKIFKKVNKNNNEIKYKSLCSFLLKLKKKNEIDDKSYKILYPKNFRTPVAYFLPKTHKIDYKTNLKYRPIISAYNSYSYTLSKFLANLLTEELKMDNPSTDDFLKKLRMKNYNKNSYIVSLDIESMFPSIPLDEVIEKATDIIFNRQNNLFSKESIKNYFYFAQKK